MRIDNEFKITETVFLKTDTEQMPHIITGILVRPNMLVYVLSCPSGESFHYEFEISRTKELKYL